MPPKKKLRAIAEEDVEMGGVDNIFESATLSNALEVAEGEKPRQPRKRKSPHEYSDNPHTIKARKNAEKIDGDPIEREIRLAKGRDQIAVTRAYNKLRLTATFQDASPEAQSELLKYERERVMAERKSKQIDTGSVAKKLGKDGHPVDPFDPNWSDVMFSESEAEEEEMLLQEDDEKNELITLNDQVIGRKEEFVYRASRLLPNATNKTWAYIAYKLWRKGWFEVYDTLSAKLYVVNNSTLIDLINRLPVWYDESGRLFPVTPPHAFFTEDEKKLWRNLTMWSSQFMETASDTTLDCDSVSHVGKWRPKNTSVISQPSDTVISLPGPAEWWEMDEGYSIVEAGFYFPKGTRDEYERIFYMVTQFTTLPKNGMWNLIDHTDKELRVRW